MNKIIQKICDQIVWEYKQNKNVLGIMLFGSAVNNKFDKYSDIDIYVLLKKEDKYSRYSFLKDDALVEIIFDTVGKIKSYLKEEKVSVRRNVSHMLAHGKILYETGDNFKKLQTIAKHNLKSKTNSNREEILMHKYSIDDFWDQVQRDTKNKNYLSFGLTSQLLLNNIIELFLKRHGEFLRPPSEMSEVLGKLDKNFYGRIKNFYKTANIKTKKRILSGLIKYIYKKTGGSLPDRWSLPTRAAL